MQAKTIIDAKAKREKYIAAVLSNGDSPKQLLARSRYIITKSKVIGQKIKRKEQSYSSSITQISKQPKSIAWNLETFIS